MMKKEQLKNFGLLTLGTLLVSAGIYFFKFPNNFSTGGVSGLAVVLSHYFAHLTPATFVSISNLALLVLGFLVFGKSFGIKTAYSTVLSSITIQLLEIFYPMAAPMTGQPLLELMMAVALPAVGSAILFNMEASTGGTDIVAMILAKYTSLNIGRALMISDFVITLGAWVAFGPETGLCSMVGLFIKSFVIDLMIENINLCKYFTIVCKDADRVCEYITHSLGRGATILEATGAYSHDNKQVVLTVLRRYQAVQLRKYVRSIEPGAFMMITNTSEIIGKGFRVD